MAKVGVVVAVTGASGFVGSHVVRELLEQGYTVHASVRNPDDKTKTDFLRNLPGAAEGRLIFFASDLEKEGSFLECFTGASYVIHTAAVVKVYAKHPQQEIVDPAVNGMKNVLNCVKQVGSVKRVVITSSVAATHDDPREKGDGYKFSEKDWNTSSTVNEGPYMLAKTLSEKFAWEFAEQEHIDLVAILPSYIAGPPLNNVLAESATTFKELLSGKYPACPQIGFSFIDVRDVAHAHIVAMQKEDAHGRYIVSNGFMWFVDMAKQLKQQFPEYPLPTRNLPNFVMYLSSFFDKRVSRPFLKKFLNARQEFDTTRAQGELGLSFIPLDQCFLESCNALIDLGCVPDKRKRSGSQ
jgi:nucleoside-diphosphate-sugar epimerase